MEGNGVSYLTHELEKYGYRMKAKPIYSLEIERNQYVVETTTRSSIMSWEQVEIYLEKVLKNMKRKEKLERLIYD